MHRIRRSRLILVLACVLVATSALAASTGASEPDGAPASSAAPQVSPRSTSGCAVLMEPVGPADASGARPTQPRSLGCYASEREMVAKVQSVASASALTAYWLATGYGHLNFGGNWIAFYGGAPCGGVQGIPNIEAYQPGWGNRIRSSQGTCNNTRWFATTQYGGASIICSKNCNSMGVLDQNANSVYFYN